jgi:VWFA-related protein
MAMRQSIIAMMLVLLAAPAWAAGQAQLGQPDVSQFPQVRLFVYPTGPHGEPLTGLRQEQFAVTEDGRPVALEELRDAATAVPLEVCLAIDRSGSMLDEAKMTSAKAAARQFIAAMRPSDRGAVVSFASSATLDRVLTGDRAGLVAAIEAMHPGDSTALYDGVYWAVEQVSLRAGRSSVYAAGTPGSRRVVLALTDGIDNASHAGPADVVRQARANGVTIYTIGLGSDAAQDDLRRLASATGGRYFYAPTGSQLAQLYGQIAQQLRSEYALTYRTPRPSADGTRRNVAVQLRDAGVDGTATGWYQAPGTGSLVVSVTPGSESAGAPVGAAGGRPGEPFSAAPSGGPASSPYLALALVAVVGIAGAVCFFLSRRRDRPLRAAAADTTSVLPGPLGRASNPPIDLMPLWVRGPITCVGRADENDVVIDSPLVSRRHARIERAGGAYRLFDHGSTHGTYVNGRRVEEAALQVGDVVRFADREFRFAGDAA